MLKLLAERATQGARAAVPSIEVGCLEVEEAPIEQLRPGETQAEMQRRRAAILDRLAMGDAVVVGTPAYFGSIASPGKRLFEDCFVASGGTAIDDRSRPWRAPLLRQKVGAAFTASGTPHGVNELALHSVLTLFMHLYMLVVTPGQGDPILENATTPYGATAVAGASGDHLPTEAEQAAACALGERVARITTWLRSGRTDWERAHPSQPSRASEPTVEQHPELDRGASALRRIWHSRCPGSASA